MKKVIKKVSVKKAQAGTKLGALSVKAGVDNNPGVTRADIITGAKKKAQSGVQISKKDMKKNPEDFKFLKTTKKTKKAKSGGSMKKCKGGC